VVAVSEHLRRLTRTREQKRMALSAADACLAVLRFAGDGDPTAVARITRLKVELEAEIADD